MVRKLLFAILVAILTVPTHATLTPSGPGIGNCVTGYVRYAPGFCRAKGRILLFTGFNGAADNVLRNQVVGAMTFLPNYPPPSSARALLLLVDGKICASGVVGTKHELNMASYYDSAGTTQHTNFALTAYEFAAIALGAWFGGGQMEMVYPITGTNLQITTKFVDSAGAGFGTMVQGAYLAGYFDGR